MKDGGNDEKRQDNSEVENMARVSIDGWWLTAHRIGVQLFHLPLKIGKRVFRNSSIMKTNIDLCVDMWKKNTPG